jgi:hypothetical protein
VTLRLREGVSSKFGRSPPVGAFSGRPEAIEMEALDRRLDGAVRMPVDLLVQLSHDMHQGELYDADAVNLGPEGLGLRSAILPDIGQRLRCRFELPDDGGVCETDAQVVWASDTGTRTGEFGVKFDMLEPRVQAVVDRWVSTIEGGTPRVITPVSTASPEVRRAASSRGKSAFVHLDGVGTSIEGIITSEDPQRIAVAQPLPFLALGKGATLEIGDDTDRRALSNVELLIENGVPRLVLTLEKMERNARATTKSAPPDLRSPDATITEDDEIAPPALVVRSVVEAKRASSEWVTSEEPETPAPAADREPDSLDDAPVRAARDLDRMREREPVRAVRVSSEELGEGDADTAPSVSLTERVTPQLVKLVAAMRAAWTITIATTGPWAKRAAAWLVQAAKTAATYVREHAPERLGSLLGRAPVRRTTTPPPAAVPGGLRRSRTSEVPAPPVSPMRGKGRLALAGVMAVVAVGLTAYALSGPAAAEPEAPVVPVAIAAPVESTPEPALMPPPVTAEATPIETGAEISAAPIAAEPTPPAVVGGHLPAPTFPTLGSTSASAASSRAAEPEEASAAPIASAPSTAFGADEVANGRTSTLRMSQPITSLVGQADESGFTVTVDGALSLDRAGPIAAANPSVERASILNRGDHCVLTVRFISGRSPAYRVAIRGQAVEVTIGR